MPMILNDPKVKAEMNDVTPTIMIWVGWEGSVTFARLINSKLVTILHETHRGEHCFNFTFCEVIF